MFTQTVYSQTDFATAATQAYGLQELLIVALAILLLIAILLTIIFILTGWFFLILSGGKEDKVKPAISMIRYSVIWLIVILIFIFAIPPLSRAIGFSEVGERFVPNQIFSTMGCVTDRLFGNGTPDCFEYSGSIQRSNGTYNGSGWTNDL